MLKNFKIVFLGYEKWNSKEAPVFVMTDTQSSQIEPIKKDDLWKLLAIGFGLELPKNIQDFEEYAIDLIEHADGFNEEEWVEMIDNIKFEEIVDIIIKMFGNEPQKELSSALISIYEAYERLENLYIKEHDDEYGFSFFNQNKTKDTISKL